MSKHLQPGILAMGSRSHFYLELDVPDLGQAAEVLEIAGDGLSEPRATTGGANLVVGFSPRLWAELGDVPAGLRDFTAVTGPDGFTMPATQHDIWVWASAGGADVVWDVARAAAAAFGPVATLATQQGAFTYRASRDISGFEDGTENPPLSEAPAIASVPDGEPGEGGSVVLVQRWVHDLDAFHERTEEEQEAIIGRTKGSSEELDDAIRPETSHISRVVIEEDGEELEIFRRSTSFGDVIEHGLVFVGFSGDATLLDRMLQRMVGNDGPRDALTTWTTPVTGAYYYCPPAEAFVS